MGSLLPYNPAPLNTVPTQTPQLTGVNKPLSLGDQRLFPHLCGPLQSISARVHSVPRITALVIVFQIARQRLQSQQLSQRHALRQATDGALSGAAGCYQSGCKQNGATGQGHTSLKSTSQMSSLSLLVISCLSAVLWVCHCSDSH